jgi:ADP-heptose:LPS heptosyltransferase
MKALIVRLSAIGDVVHTLPAAAALHEAGWSVGWVVEPAARVLLEGNAAVSHVFHAPAARAFVAAQARSALARLRAEHYDVALDSQGLWKSAVWARLSGARRVVGYNGSSRREPASAWLMGERVQPPVGITHVIDKNLALLRPLGVEAVGTFRCQPQRHIARLCRLVSRRWAWGTDASSCCSIPVAVGPASSGRRSTLGSWRLGCVRAASRRS